ncbi:MAG: tetraacyldisaccharide 4'-kinase [Melioribacteraceae bacterium]|nr:MAG: tetraacyldisaccharide 4'-kinase [Melioribacteraceae bacterium]
MLDFLRILFLPLVPVYGLVIRARNFMFNRGYYKSEQVGAKVISIGNITVGGSGKTPTVLFLTELLKNMDRKVGVLSRGYRRKTKGYQLVSRHDGPEMKVEDCGDEIYLVADELRVPAAVSERRVEGARKFLKDVELDTIVLDDAFQHRWIKRDCNIVIFDQRFLQKVGKLEQFMLPSGLMREPFSAIERADIIIINSKFTEKKEIPEKLKHHFEGKEIFYASYEATGFYDVKSHHFYDIDDFKGQKSLVVCGIAKPYSFLKILEEHRIDISNKELFTDHKFYTEKEIQDIRKLFYSFNAHSVLTTQKDAVKLTQYAKELDDIDIYYLKIALKIEEEEKFINRIKEVIT